MTSFWSELLLLLLLQVYLALAKGGLVSQHVLIIPVTHHFSTTSIPESVASEIEQYPFDTV